MMVSCSAIGCINRSFQSSSNEDSFHKIPSVKKVSLCQQWLTNIRREGPLPKDNSFYICSRHFEPSCFKRDLQVENFHLMSMYFLSVKFIIFYYFTL